MPANAAGRKAVLNVWNADGNIVLVALTHPDFATQRLALCLDDVVSSADGSSQTYTAYPFEIELPTDDKGVPRGTIRLSNVTRQVWDLVGGLSSPPQLTIYRVLESDLNTVQDVFAGLDIKRVSAAMLTLEAEFGSENYATEPYPAARVIPPYCPWMLYVG
jgi:hypothetical protein